MLWSEGRISGIVDWVETSLGPAWLDVAHCCTNIALVHGNQAADLFAAAYTRRTGRGAQAYFDVMDIVGFLPPPEGKGPFHPTRERENLEERLRVVMSRTSTAKPRRNRGKEIVDFYDALEALTPVLGDAVEAEGEQREPDLELNVAWMARVGHAIVTCLPQLREETAIGVFDLVERTLREGSQPIQDAVATGMLEAISNDLDLGRVTHARLAALIGPESRAYLLAWDEFTTGSSPWTEARGRIPRLRRRGMA